MVVISPAGYGLSKRGAAVWFPVLHFKPRGLLTSQARNPLLQNCLASWLKFAEGNAHPGVRLGVNHLAEGGKTCAAMRNSQRDFRSLREWACRVHAASKQAQVAGACCKKSFRAHIRQLNTSCKRITAGAVESRANGTTTSLLRILSQAGYSSKECTPIHALHSRCTAYALEPFFLRSAQRFFIISDNRFLPAGVSRSTFLWVRAA
jgi:hypothetical protein